MNPLNPLLRGPCTRQAKSFRLRAKTMCSPVLNWMVSILRKLKKYAMQQLGPTGRDLSSISFGPNKVRIEKGH